MDSSTPQQSEQSEQAQTPREPQGCPDWVSKRIARARLGHAVEPFTEGHDALSVLWLADTLAQAQAEAERLSSENDDLYGEMSRKVSSQDAEIHRLRAESSRSKLLLDERALDDLAWAVRRYDELGRESGSLRDAQRVDRLRQLLSSLDLITTDTPESGT